VVVASIVAERSNFRQSGPGGCIFEWLTTLASAAMTLETEPLERKIATG